MVTFPYSSLMRGHHGASGRETGHERLLPVLAVGRSPGAIVLIGAGLVLLTCRHADWPDLARRFTDQIGLDPSRNLR